MRVLMFTIYLLFSVVCYAGDLNPPAAPASTMKTLDEVEPRIPIPASDTPATTFTISEKGSYYLIGNRHCGITGIQVDANDVTIDLMGYSLIGTGASSSGSGVYMRGRKNVEIRNGVIRGFGRGIYEQLTASEGHKLINVRAVSNLTDGISLFGFNNLVKNCTVNDNGAESSSSARGIYVGTVSMVVDNMVYGNGLSATTDVDGIRTGTGCTVTGNTVYDNGYSAEGHVSGIQCGTGSTIIGNNAYRNGASLVGDVNIYGIYADSGSTIKDNTAYSNGSGSTATSISGIYADYGSTVIGNTSFDNGYTGVISSGYGIWTSSNCLIDQNTAYGNEVQNLKTGTNCTLGTNHAP